MARLVVRRDRDVDKLERGVGVAEGDDGDVDVGRLADGLVVDARVGDDDEPGFLEGAGDVVCEGAGGEAAGDGLGAGAGGEFEDGALAVGAGGDDADVGGVLDSGDDTGCKDDFFPGLADVDDVDTWSLSSSM